MEKVATNHMCIYLTVGGQREAASGFVGLVIIHHSAFSNFIHPSSLIPHP
ncbi:MAG: hypothetical protein ABSG67_06855 [Thermoguttaceae bacterium]|jgi:hypothetical protein